MNLTIDYKTPSGLHFNYEIIVFTVAIGLCLFCCGLSVACIIVYKYKKDKRELMEEAKRMRYMPSQHDI